MFEQLKDLLPKAINQKGLKGEMHALAVINEFNKYCEELVGDRSTQNLKCKFCKNRSLYIDASDASWAQHLQLNQTGIIQQINSKFDKPAIDRLVINIKNN